MAQLRRKYSIARLSAAVLAVALAFTCPLPWMSCGVLSLGLLVPIVLSGLTAIETVVIFAISYVTAMLMIPSVTTNCYRNRRVPVVPAKPAAAPVRPPTRS